MLSQGPVPPGQRSGTSTLRAHSPRQKRLQRRKWLVKAVTLQEEWRPAAARGELAFYNGVKVGFTELAVCVQRHGDGKRTVSCEGEAVL